MTEKNINFDNKKVDKRNFYRYKRPLSLDDIDVDKILISRKEPYAKKSSFKHIKGYGDHDYIGLLYIRLPQMTGYVKGFDNNKTMPFRVRDNNLL